MIFQEIYSDIVNSFGSLWKFKERGNTLEIITPFATTNHKFISVFLTKRNNEFIVSDGGWIENSEYETTLLNDEDAFQKLLFHYINTFDIMEIKGNGVTHFYKKTSIQLMIPSIVFDMSNFISSIISASEVVYTDAKEIESRKLFQRDANNYISSFVHAENIDYKGYLDKERTIKLNAIYKCSDKSNLILLNYITGTNNNSFNNSIFKADVIFGMANNSLYSPHIKSKVAFVNNIAEGYNPLKSSHFLNYLIESTNTIAINWSEREKLKHILN